MSAMYVCMTGIFYFCYFLFLLRRKSGVGLFAHTGLYDFSVYYYPR